MTIEHVGMDNFQSEVVDSDVPVLIDFYADWCGPCKVLAPVLEDLSDKYEGAIKVFKVNVMDEMELAKKFGVSNIPFVAAFKNGTMVKSQVGFAGRDSVEKLFEELSQ